MVKHIKTELLILPHQPSVLHLSTNNIVLVITLALQAACSAVGHSLFPLVWALKLSESCWFLSSPTDYIPS